VTRAGDLSGAASARWAVAGAAVNGAGFTGGILPTGTVSFAGGESSKVISVNVAGDTDVETNEAFSVKLSSHSAGTRIGVSSANGIIRNDDASLSVATTSATRAEGQSGSTPFTFTLTRTGDLSGATSAHWAVNGAAVNGADFTGGVLPTGTVNFATGGSSTVISIGVAGDTAVESSEAFSVTLSSPSAGASLGVASATGIIRNDDSSLSIAATSADKPEDDLGATPFTFTVTRAGDLSGPASVDWAASGTDVIDSDFIPFDELLGSAEQISVDASYIGSFFSQIPSDTETSLPAFSLFGCVMPSGSVSFADGEACKTVTVWVLEEIVIEADESFVVTLSNPSAGTVIDTASAVGTIRNDDSAYTIESFSSLVMGTDLLGWS
jgi:hypothetical protein